jgi:hypothetical protein
LSAGVDRAVRLAHTQRRPTGAAVELIARRLDDTRRVLLAQGGYYIATGVLPFLSRRAFAALTGPKREWWLVETVGGIVTVVGASTMIAARRREPPPEVLAAAAGTATVLALIDVVHVAKGRIAPTYLADAGTELGLIAALAVSHRRRNARARRLRRIATALRGG